MVERKSLNELLAERSCRPRIEGAGRTTDELYGCERPDKEPPTDKETKKDGDPSVKNKNNNDD